jgi:hypothetical protein
MLRLKTYIEEKFKTLTAGELLKPGREGRAKTIVKKIESGSPFLLSDETKTVIIDRSKFDFSAFENAINMADNATLNKFEFIGIDGNLYRLKDFAKSPEFGGKGSGSGTRAEDAALADLKEKLQKILESKSVPFIYVTIGKKTEKVMSLESTKGTPKSDFHMLDPERNQVFWISHKKGKKANDFQQYGGMSEINTEFEVKKFAEDVRSTLEDPTTFPMKTAYYRPVTSKPVIMKTLFGKDYKPSKADSIQNIDVLFQGTMNFVPSGNKDGVPSYKMSSNHTVLHSEIPTGDYAPYYYVRPEQAKNQFRIKKARFFIVSKLTATKNRNAKPI